MNCKNCEHILAAEAHFCSNCGAKVRVNRITFKILLVEFFINVFGFDSKFFLTLRKVARHPHILVTEFLGGVRNRYMNPFAFLAVGAAISLVVFNYFEEDFKRVNSEINASQIATYKEKASLDISKLEGLSEKEIQKLEIEKKGAQMQLKFMDGMMDFMLRYYNLMSFVFILIYAMLSKWTYLKPHNYGEHVIINAYFFGYTLFFSLILFFLALWIHPMIYNFSILFYILFYMFAFGKLYQLSLGKNILKFLRFILGLILMTLVFTIVAFLIGLTISYLKFI